MEESELRAIRELARREGQTVAEWVRQTLRTARQGRSLRDPAAKLLRVREAARHAFPSGNIEEMLKEIEQGYL
jgi:hypothetical protein